MPDFLALDWEQQQLYGLEAQVSTGRVRVKTGLHLPLPEAVGPSGTPEAVGRWLREQLDRNGVATKQVLVSIPREDAVVRRLELPNAPDEELPDLVRMQAATKSATPLDQLLLDYLPLPSEPGAAGREVLMVTIAKSAGERIRAILTAADLELKSIGLSSVGAAELATRADRQRGDQAGGTSLVVGRQGQRLEIAIVRAGRLTFSHAAQLQSDDEERANRLVMTEIQRSIIARQPASSTNQISHIWVIGTDEESRGLVPLLQDRFACPAHSLDPLREAGGGFDASNIPGTHVAFAGPAGMLLHAAGGTVEAVDFLNPRRRVVKPDRRRLKAGVAAAGVGAALLLGYGLLQLRLGRLDDQIADAKDEIKQLDDAVKKGEPTLAAYQTINGWEATQPNWLQRLQEFKDLLPGTHRLYFSDLKVGPGSVPGKAIIKGNGVAKDRSDVEDLNERLRGADFVVLPQKWTTERRSGDYPVPFTLDLIVDVNPQPAAAEPTEEAKL